MRRLINLIVAVILLVASSLPCGAYDARTDGHSDGQQFAIIAVVTLKVSSSHANGSGPLSGIHCQQNDLLPFSSAGLAVQGADAVFNMTSASASVGQIFSVIQRPPIFHA
jgi:hypothetical protein